MNIRHSRPVETIPRAGDTSSFDFMRHHGKMNVLYVDGHGDSQTLPNPGGTWRANGPLSQSLLIDP